MLLLQISPSGIVWLLFLSCKCFIILYVCHHFSFKLSVKCPNLISHSKFFLVIFLKKIPLDVFQLALNIPSCFQDLLQNHLLEALCTIFLVIFFFSLILNYLFFGFLIFLFLGFLPLVEPILC